MVASVSGAWGTCSIRGRITLNVVPIDPRAVNVIRGIGFLLIYAFSFWRTFKNGRVGFSCYSDGSRIEPIHRIPNREISRYMGSLGFVARPNA